ncbi:TonB-dependent receptor plug domain-containing protein [Opitutus sp. ER46]|uniref:TonB-dependent siderophore receptor n=1 Tax=Opitutus sp. ER46 TaxID=2161864 RepID=UPI001304FAF3|nr:TonB-dependent receptor plug domain-containing protein [Opitutus sp. ER46]
MLPPKFALAFGLTLGLPASLLAQSTTPPPTATGADNDELVRLTPFIVNTDRDNGYIAVDALAGGRTNTPVKLTPSSMSSITRAFIDDVAITNVRDALRWSPNVVPSDYLAGKQLANPFNAWDYNFRGAGQSLQGGAGPGRNYFTFYNVADTYNLDRIEFDRGPNSILYGVGTVGGVLSTYTKIPRLDKNFLTPTVTFDSNGSARFEADFNRRLTDKFATRINALYDRNRGWRNNDKNDAQAIDIAMLYKFTERTSARVEVEGYKAKNTLISSTYGDGMSAWDGSANSATWGAAPTGTGTRASQSAGWWTANYNVWIPGLASKGIMNWNGGTISAGIDPDGIPAAPYAGYYPKEFKPLYSWMNGGKNYSTAKVPVLPEREFTYGNGISKPQYTNATAYLDHSFSDNLDAEVAFYRYESKQNAKDYEGASNIFLDLNKQLPDGTANPNYGKPFADFFLSQQQQNRTVTEIRAQLNYHFTADVLGIPLKQLFTGAAGQQRITWYARQYMAELVNTGNNDAAQNMIWGRLYFDQPNAEMNIPDVVNGKVVAYVPWSSDWFDFDETYKLKSASLASHTRLWNDKLSILAGLRHDNYDHNKVQAHSRSRVEDGASGTTYSAGAIYYFKWFGLFANYAKNFDPIGPGKNLSLSGTPFGPAEGKSFEYGIRISTDDGKYYASLSRYDSESTGRITTTKIDFAGMWKNYYDALGQSYDTKRTQLSYDDTEALKVKGYEIDLTANPTKNIRLSATYGKPDSQIQEALAGQRAYYAANLATWNTATGGTSTPATNLKSQLQSALNTLNQNAAGKTKTGLVDYTASVFVNYTFTDNALRGFSIGGGVARTGQQYVGDFGAPDGQPKFKYYADARTSTSLVLAYETKLRHIPVRFALNIDNVLDDTDPIVTGYHWGWMDPNTGRNIASGYMLPAPRTFRFSARFTF